MFDEGDALAVDGVDQVFGIGVAVALFEQATEFFGARGVEEDVESVGLFAEEVGCAAAYHYGIAFLGDSGSDLLHQGNHAVGIEGLSAESRTAFVTAAPESFG